LAFFFRLLPNFAFSNGLLNLANRTFLSYVIANSKTKLSAFDSTVALWDLLFLIFETVVYFIIVFLIEKYRIRATNAVHIGSGVQRKHLQLDDDVQREHQELANANPMLYSVCVKDLRKVYMLGVNNYKVAVETVSFGIKKGECFALLGVNGAGKTTTFKVLSGEVTQTEGKAFIAGFDTETQMEEIRPLIGYCPQFDALLDNLTAREHLHLYCAIKGIPTEFVKIVLATL
jgi:ATP-binding cassette subfamily A (ABC1) protein 3